MLHIGDLPQYKSIDKKEEVKEGGELETVDDFKNFLE
jgi:hypothetical protein